MVKISFASVHFIILYKYQMFFYKYQIFNRCKRLFFGAISYIKFVNAHACRKVQSDISGSARFYRYDRCNSNAIKIVRADSDENTYQHCAEHHRSLFMFIRNFITDFAANERKNERKKKKKKKNIHIENWHYFIYNS